MTTPAASSQARLLIVSNRLPVTVRSDRGDVVVVPSTGGLATGLKGPHERSGGVWIGWPGDVSRLDADQREQLDTRLADLKTAPVYLTQGEVSRFYDGFSNGVLWPLFHYLVDRIPNDTRDFDAYRKVNERYADAVTHVYQPGDVVWIHDYQLMLLPAMLRKRLPEAKIGFFLHIPFPATEIFRTLPWRAHILEGLLGADLIGFHTFAYSRHFATALLRVLGIEALIDRVPYDGREVRIGVFPMGIDAATFRALAAEEGVVDEARTIRAQGGETKLLLGIDRLDYTKGIPRRLLGIERLFERDPQLRGRVRFVQLAVPSRTSVEAYSEFRREVDELVGRINGAFGTVAWSPIQYMYRAISQRHLVALYRAADVMLVTPLRDGMNLVAKEFVASREDEDGVLVLSEFAGAAAELGDALLVNPYDVEQMAQTLKQSLAMPAEERQVRMRGLRRRVLAYDVHKWAENFLEELKEAPPPPANRETGDGITKLMVRLVSHAQRDAPLLVLLDYDGTLVRHANLPQLVRPDEELMAILRTLSSRPHTRLHIVSGRTREWLEQAFGSLPVALHAEHGFWSRPDPKRAWTSAGKASTEWMAKAKRTLEEFAASTPGAFVEEKSATLAWHYRMADAEFGALQAKELRLHLSNAFSNAPVEVLVGDKVIELRPQGVNKSLIVKLAVAEIGAGATILAMGNDATDEDMFAALPEDAFTVHVGRGASRARYRVPNPQAARAVLGALVG
jgi:trehalose 6-phosphate synthase/phosphatase